MLALLIVLELEVAFPRNMSPCTRLSSMYARHFSFNEGMPGRPCHRHRYARNQFPPAWPCPARRRACAMADSYAASAARYHIATNALMSSHAQRSRSDTLFGTACHDDRTRWRRSSLFSRSMPVETMADGPSRWIVSLSLLAPAPMIPGMPAST